MEKSIKKYLFCNNCGKKNHEFKECRDPVTSYGILLFDLVMDDDDRELYLEQIKSKYNNENNSEMYDIEDMGIKVNNDDDILKFSKYNNAVRFLMIQRKHTLGYTEFIRGRYKNDNVDGIASLFQQMLINEINNIAQYDFEKLWNDFWGSDSMTSEYDKAKDKFNSLKNGKDEMNLNFFIDNVVPLWKIPEWGFPKGRRFKQEDNLTCAIREFEEETNLNKNDYEILKNINPIVEDLIGTNGIKYRHVYYVAYLKNTNVKLAITNKSQKNEIGAINMVSYETGSDLIRPYHTAKKKVLMKLYMFVLNAIIDCD